jgi:hypothetical protein
VRGLLRWWSDGISGSTLVISLGISVACIIAYWLSLSTGVIRADQTSVYSWCGLWPKRIRWEQVSSISIEPPNRLAVFLGFRDEPSYLLNGETGQTLMKRNVSNVPKDEQERLLNFARQQLQQRQSRE